MEDRGGLSDEAVSSACKAGDPITQDYMMQQTMLRVKDPARSLDFYTRILGMTLLQKIDFPSMRFTLYFLGYEQKSDIPADIRERTAWTFSRRATVELTHNWGSESNKSLSYHNGNNEPRGFGHIGIAVPDVHAACKFFEEQRVTFIKKPESEGGAHVQLDVSRLGVDVTLLTSGGQTGKMKDLAFIRDPDGYWIEILSPQNMFSLLSP